MYLKITAKPCQNLISIPNETHPRQRRVVQQNFGSGSEVRQKLKASQLIEFLRPGTTHGSSSLMQQHDTMAIASVDQKVKALACAMNDVESESALSEVKRFNPIFPDKNSGCDFADSRWTVATSRELWDTVDFSIHSLQKPAPPKMMGLLYHDEKKDFKVPELSSTSTCASGDHPRALEGSRDTHTLMDANEDTTAVRVKIPEFQIRKFEEIPVVIAHIVNLDNFFIQHEDTNLLEISEMLLKESSRRVSFAEINRIPDIGAYVMAWLPKPKIWCRGQVCKINEMCRATRQKEFAHIKVELRRIDYGDVACVYLRNIKELCGETASRPVQTLQVSLANVRPVNGANWSFEAISWFKCKVKNKTLYARLYPERGKVLVELFMEKGKIGAMRRGDSLSVQLAQHGYAQHKHQRVRVLRSDVQHKTRQQSLEWEKYLLSCYCPNKK